MESDLEQAGEENQQGQAPQNTGSDDANKGFAFTATIAAAVVALSYYLSVIESDFTGFNRFLIHWLSACGFAFDVAFICYRYKPPKPWPLMIWTGYITVCVGMLLHNVWQIYNPNAFSFVATRIIHSGPPYKIRRSNKSFWIVGSGQNPDVYPIDLLIFVRFTNHKTTSCMIERYGLETKKDNGEWTPAPTIGLRDKVMYGGDDLHHADKIEFDQGTFNSVIDHKNIAPDETIEGWLFIGYPEGMNINGLRIRILEADGTDYTKNVGDTEKVLSGEVVSVQTASMTVHPEDRDLSAYHVVDQEWSMP